MAKLNKAFNTLELSAFCGQLATILNSGIPVSEGLAILLEDSDNESERRIIQEILNNLTETSSLSTALKSTNLFPNHMIGMIEIGEETGNLDTVTKALASSFRREYNIKKTITSAITYPIIMMTMMLVVIIILLVKVMPVFNQVFIQLGAEMTGLAAGLMSIGTTINNYAIFFTLALIILIIVAVLSIKTSQGHALLIKLACKFKGSRSIYEETFSCQVAAVMSLTLASGLYPQKGLELAAALTKDSSFIKRIDACKKQLENGNSLAKALHDNNIFKGIYSSMANMGERTGNLDKTLAEIADLYQEEIDNKTNNILAIVEPTLVAVLSVIVGIILLSVMIPLLGIMAAL